MPINSIRSRFEASLAGEPVRWPVYAVYDWFVKNRQIDWPVLFAQGLGQINHADLVSCHLPHVQIDERVMMVDGQPRRDVRWTTDVGELHEWYLGEWRQEYLIKRPDDYRVLGRALADARLQARPQTFAQSEAAVGTGGITLGQLSPLRRTPLQQVQIDYVGLEQLSLHLADELPPLMELLEQLYELLVREFEVAAKTPARQIKLWENLTLNSMGPAVYRRHLVPVYEQILRVLAQSGQKLLVHYDGQLRFIADDIARLAFDGIDSFTEAPEGDMATADARRRWPDKFLWLHPCLGWYEHGLAALVSRVRRMVADAGMTRFCLMISEEVPANWRETVPALLRALEPG